MTFPEICEPVGRFVFGTVGKAIVREEEAVFCRADHGRNEAGRGRVLVPEFLRKVGISEQTFNRWKKQYLGLEVDQVRQMKQLQEESTRLKQLVAELSLDTTMLQDVLRNKW